MPAPGATVSKVAISRDINADVDRLDELPSGTLSNCTLSVTAVAGLGPEFCDRARTERNDLGW